MFRDLIPRLASHFHVLAPDYPGYGYSEMPSGNVFKYTFDHLAEVMEAFLRLVGATSYVLYMHDFGGPVGFRLATAQPDRVRGIIIQNANAYDEGVSPKLKESIPVWARRDAEAEKQMHFILSAEGIRWQYLTGARDPASMTRDGLNMDIYQIARHGQFDIQFDLHADYISNLGLYPKWHEWLRRDQPATLIVWGTGDPIFLLDGAQAMMRDVPKARLIAYRGSHFLLEEYAPNVANQIIDLFSSLSDATA
jgi:pimeloyl-ACP methyl ester carboxylesterase